MRYSFVLLFPCIIMYCFEPIFGYLINLQEAHKSVEKLREYFNSIDHGDAGEGVIFLRLLDTWKEEGEKKLLLSQIVPMYLNMLDSIKHTEQQEDIKNIKMMLHTSNEDLLKQSDQKLKDLNELKKMQMTDTKTQHTAVKELFRVFQEIRYLEKIKNNASNHDHKKQIRAFQRRRRGSKN